MSRAVPRLGPVVLIVATILGLCHLPGANAATHPRAPTGRGAVSGACRAARGVASWSTDRLIEQLIVAPVDAGAISGARPEVAAGVGGLILTGVAPVDLKGQIARTLRFAPGGIVPLVMTDEEGGAVQRLVSLVGDLPSARTMGATMTPFAIDHLAFRLARSMRGLGLTMDLAPVADIDARPGPSLTNADGTRSFGANPAQVTADALAFAAGLERGGVIPVIKHFPGLGGALANTDFAAANTPPWSSVERSGLVPFARAIDARIPAVMVSNAMIPGLSRVPASLSGAVITGELRTRLHFRGLVLTDSLSAVAIGLAHYSLETAAVAALRAGADMVLFNASAASLYTTTTSIVSAIDTAIRRGVISRAQILRAVAEVLSVKHLAGCLGAIGKTFNA